MVDLDTGASAADPLPRARSVDRAVFGVGVFALAGLMLAGVLQSWRTVQRFPGVDDIGLVRLAERVRDGAPAEALRELSLASQFFADPAIATRLVEVAEQQKDLDGRIQGTRRLVELGAARDAQTLTHLAALLLKRGRTLESLTGMAPDLDLDDTREALTWSTRAALLEPDNVAAHLHRGIAYAGLGRREEALAHVREALRLDPERPLARQVLRVLTLEEGKP